jgi:hypothetical protein
MASCAMQKIMNQAMPLSDHLFAIYEINIV